MCANLDPRYGERYDFQTYINMDYLPATWPTALAAVYKLMAQPCSSRMPKCHRRLCLRASFPNLDEKKNPQEPSPALFNTFIQPTPSPPSLGLRPKTPTRGTPQWSYLASVRRLLFNDSSEAKQRRTSYLQTAAAISVSGSYNQLSHVCGVPVRPVTMCTSVRTAPLQAGPAQHVARVGTASITTVPLPLCCARTSFGRHLSMGLAQTDWWSTHGSWLSAPSPHMVSAHCSVSLIATPQFGGGATHTVARRLRASLLSCAKAALAVLPLVRW